MEQDVGQQQKVHCPYKNMVNDGIEQHRKHTAQHQVQLKFLQSCRKTCNLFTLHVDVGQMLFLFDVKFVDDQIKLGDRRSKLADLIVGRNGIFLEVEERDRGNAIELVTCSLSVSFKLLRAAAADCKSIHSRVSVCLLPHSVTLRFGEHPS